MSKVRHSEKPNAIGTDFLGAKKKAYEKKVNAEKKLKDKEKSKKEQINDFYKQKPNDSNLPPNDRLLSEDKQDIKVKETNDTISNENKGDDDGSTRLRDNDKTIPRDIPTRDKSRSTYSSRERESRISDQQRDRTYKKGNFKRIREKLFPYREEAKEESIFRYYSSKIPKITREEVKRYLDSIFPDSKIKDILYHGTSVVFDKFDKSFLDRQRNSKDTSKEVLDSSLAFFATDDIVNASFYSIRSKDFYLKRLRDTFKDMDDGIIIDEKDFFERLDNLRYFSDNFKDIADIKELSIDNKLQLRDFFEFMEEEFEEQSIDEQEYTNTLYYTEAMLKEIERIETAFYNGTLLDHNIFGDPNKESIQLTIGRDNVGIYKDPDAIAIEVGKYFYYVKNNEKEPYDLNNAFNAILDLLERTDYRYDRYGFNTEVMPVVINSQNISSKDYLNLSDNVLDEHTKQANEAFNSGKDTIEYLNVKDPVRATNYGIFNPDNIHILGSDEDIKALKEFLGKEGREETSKSNISVHKGNWTREQVEADTDRVYVFGDNVKDQLSEYEPSSTQAVIRGLENATGLVTKHDRFTNQNSYFNDSQFEEFKQELEMGIRSIKYWLSKGKEIVFPSGGIGTGKAMLDTKSPKAFEYLNERLLEEFGFDNTKGELVTKAITKTKNSQTLSVEAVVSSTDSDVRDLYEILQSDENIRNEYTNEIKELIQSDTGIDLANSLDLDLRVLGSGKGQWIGNDGIVQNNPNFEIELTDIKEEADTFNLRVDAFVSYIGLALRQDGVGKGSIVENSDISKANTLKMTFERDITYEDITVINEALGLTFTGNTGDVGYFLNSKGGNREIEIIRYDGGDYSNFVNEVGIILGNLDYNFGKVSAEQYTKDTILVEDINYAENIQKVEGEKDDRVDKQGNDAHRGTKKTKQIRRIIHPHSWFYQVLEEETDDINERYRKKYKRQSERESTEEVVTTETNNPSFLETDEGLNSHSDGKITLNKGQQKAFDNVMEFLDDVGGRKTYSLVGSAGSGKTTLVKFILDEIQKRINQDVTRYMYMDIYISSPTHRANAVLQANNPDYKVKTLHSLLKLRADLNLEEFDAKNVKFARQRNNTQPIGNEYSLLIVDESSMINDSLLAFIEQEVNGKILFIGDLAQLQPVKQKTKSKALNSKGGVSSLTQVMRTKSSHLLNESIQTREKGSFSYQTALDSKDSGVEFTSNINKFKKDYINDFLSDSFKENPLFTRVLSGTNAMVEEINTEVNKELKRQKGMTDAQIRQNQYIEGDILMGYATENAEMPTQGIQNGNDYVVIESQRGTKTVAGIDFTGYYTALQNITSTEGQTIEEFIVEKSIANQEATHRYALELEKARQEGLQTRKWAGFYSLKQAIMFPYDVINPRSKNSYPIRVKSVDYGYAHTIHKSQGGTYNKVYILDDTINKFKDKELQQQLRYVALTRASQKSIVHHSSSSNTSRNEGITTYKNKLSFSPDVENVSNSPDLETEMNNLEKLSSRNLAEEFDNDPTIAKDIFNQMQVLDEVDGKEVSSSHQEYLRSLLDTFVDKSKKFIPEIRVILTDVANKRNGGVMNYTNNTLNLYHGNQVSPI